MDLPTYQKVILHNKVTIDSLMAISLIRLYYPGGQQMEVHLAEALPEGTTLESLEADKTLAVSFPVGQFPYQVVEKRLVLLTDRVIKTLTLSAYLTETLTKIVYNEMFGQKSITNALKATDAQSTALSSLLATLKMQAKLPADKIAGLFLPLVEAYIKAEAMKEEKLAAEYRAAYSQGRVDGLIVAQGKRMLRGVIIKSGFEGLATWIFDNPEIGADIVTQILPRGYVLIMAKPGRDIKLLDVVSVLRIEEARAKRYPFDRLDRKLLTTTGRLEGVEEWYYNSITNSINNGGFTDKRTRPTNLSLLQIKNALNIGLNFSLLADECPRHSCIYKKCSFYFYNFFRCHKIRKYGDKALVGIATSEAEDTLAISQEEAKTKREARNIEEQAETQTETEKSSV